MDACLEKPRLVRRRWAFGSVAAALAGVLTLPGLVQAQASPPQVDVETEVVSFLFGGAGGTLSLQPGSWRFSVEGFTLSVPETLHGNPGFDNSVRGLELHAERFSGGGPGGFFAGAEAGVSRLEVTHEETGGTQDRVHFSLGLRFGYRWYPGLGDLYLGPVGGVVYSLNARDLQVAGETFEVGPITPFVTLALGWSLDLGRTGKPGC